MSRPSRSGPLARPSLRPPRTRPKVLLVRQPVRSVGPDAESLSAFRTLLIGVIIAAGTAIGLWIFGLLGYTIGYAPAVRLPGLTCDTGLAMSAALRAVMSTPELVLEAGVQETGWMMLGFILIALPAAGLSAIRPFPPGGPKPPATAEVFSWAGAFAAMIAAVLMLAWINAGDRTARLIDIPALAAETPTWLTGLRVAAGLDALAVIAITLWAILTMRLVIPTWLRALSASFAFPTLILMAMAFAQSAVTATQVALPRSVCFMNVAPTEPQWRLIIGRSDSRLATLIRGNEQVIVELRDAETVLYAYERRSIPMFLTSAGSDDE
ncbi:MAG: hypothetical protein AAF432_03425 [Planctomycetota bacterium]